jgi:hypothetical protein
MTIIKYFITLHSLYRNANHTLPPQDKADIQKLVASLKCETEIIGTWVYCFAAAETGIRLLAFGFWFSFKHNAYIYSGCPKGGPAGDESLDEIRVRLGSRRITKPNLRGTGK